MIDIDKLQFLPSFEGFGKRSQDRNDRWNWNGRFTFYHKVNGRNPWQNTYQLLSKFLGKTFSEAQAAVYKALPIYQVDIFERELIVTGNAKYRGRDFYLDKDFLIRKVDKEKKLHYIYSSDYKAESYLAGTDILESSLSYMDRTFRYNFERKVLSGSELVFESKKDPRYQKLIQESNRLNKKKEKEKKKDKLSKSYSYLTRKETEKLEDLESNLIRLKALGFHEDSFKGMEYHGQKRKLKKLKITYSSLMPR